MSGMLSAIGAVGIQPDAATAAGWYRRAIALHAGGDAEARLAALESR